MADWDAFVEELAKEHSAEVKANRLELTVWSLSRVSQRADARTRRHPVGIELAVTVDGLLYLTQAFAAKQLHDLDRMHQRLRDDFVADGWYPSGPVGWSGASGPLSDFGLAVGAYEAFVARIDSTSVENAARMGDPCELTLWRLVRGSQRVESRVRRNWDGVEVFMEIDGVRSNSLPYRLEKLVLLDQVEAGARADFLADGPCERGDEGRSQWSRVG